MVSCLAFSPNGNTVALSFEGETPWLWNVTNRLSIHKPLDGHTSDVASLAFSPDGRLLAWGSEDGNLQLWDRTKGAATLEGHTSFAFSPDGRIMASGSRDGTIRLWAPRKNASIGQPLIGHTGPIQSLAFSPDGRILASGSNDQTLLLWDAKTGSRVGRPLICLSPVSHLVFHQLGAVLILDAGNGEMWNVTSPATTISTLQRGLVPNLTALDSVKQSLQIDIDVGWITRHGQDRLFWMPSSMRPDRIWGETGERSGGLCVSGGRLGIQNHFLPILDISALT